MHRRLLACLATAALLSSLGCGPSTDDIDRISQRLDEISAQLRQIEETQRKLLTAQPAAIRAQRPTEDFARVYEIPVADSPWRGKKSARVTLVEYSDFQCPFCARSKPLLHAVAEKYPDDLKVVFKHYPLAMHAAARPIALASMAAQEQGRFWEFHDAVFAHPENVAASPESLERYAREAGLDVARFQRDLRDKDQEYERRLDEDMALARTLDVRGTPTLFINGRKVQNRSLAGMTAMIEAELHE